MNKYRRTLRKLELERDGLWHLEEEFVPMHQYKFRDGEEVQVEISPSGAPTREEMIEALTNANRKLSAYAGVCLGDKELTDAILPKLRELLSRCKEADHE